jgi:hypothetical protein
METKKNMKKFTLILIFIFSLALTSKAQTINCGNFCVLSINNIDTTGANSVDVTIFNGDTNSVNYPTIVVTNSIGDTVINKSDYFYLFAHIAGDTVTQTLPTSWDSIPAGFTGTVYLTDRIYALTCSFPYPMACTVGINEAWMAGNAMVIYPNPATTTISISLNNLKNNQAYFTMYDATGRKVKYFSSTSAENKIERGDLPNGIYFINVIVGNRQLTKKIVLE